MISRSRLFVVVSKMKAVPARLIVDAMCGLHPWLRGSRTVRASSPKPNFNSCAGIPSSMGCGQFLQDPAVMWKGNDEKGHQIHIHGDCLVDRVPRLMRDALELGYSGKACWNQLHGQRV